ncbi:MAG: 16S rRNA (cytosine(1402)-N(4))-methyltransferase RsmH [Actinomycetota bacterium]|nr:16S rRNA (cytosine(1402)-N(4))-methyltransferase RsmH [Actinomycetota bacterium]
MEYLHEPVLLAEVLKYIRSTRGSTIVDCTLGGAGHAEAILDLITPEGFLLGIDVDDVALDAARIKLARFSQQNYSLVKGNFKDLDRILTKAGLYAVDGILFDLGVSSIHFDRAERGFSFRFDAPLDMRMDQSQDLTAAQVVNTYSKDELARIIKDYGEERWASRIASLIVKSRQVHPIRTTFELVDIIKKAIPAPARRRGGHPARQTFQAIRIEVNKEIEILDKSFRDAVKWLRPGGRIVIISYHSLEDRVAKTVLKDLSGGCVCPPGLPVCRCGRKAQLKIVTRKVVRPSPNEIAQNPRAESARLRAAERL